MLQSVKSSSPGLGRQKSPVPVLLYILHSGNLYGTERMALATVEGMNGYRHKVVVAPQPYGVGSVIEAAREAGLESATFASRAGLFRALLPWFARHRSIDVIGTGVVHSLLCDLLARIFRVRLRQLHVAHGGTPHSLDRKSVLNRIPVGMVAVSDFVRSGLEQRGVHAETITVIDNFLSDEQRRGYAHRAAYDPQLLNARPIDGRCVRIAIVSRVDAIKRIDMLIDSGLPDRLPDYAFDVYGTGDQFDRLKARGAAMRNVRFHGFVADIKNRLAQADFLLHLCPEEPFGLVILEAFVSGVVPVVPDRGGTAQLVEDGVTGVRFEAGNVAALEAALRRAATLEGADLQRIADAGGRLLDERYGQAAGVLRYQRAIEATEAARARPSFAA